MCVYIETARRLSKAPPHAICAGCKPARPGPDKTAVARTQHTKELEVCVRSFVRHNEWLSGFGARDPEPGPRQVDHPHPSQRLRVMRSLGGRGESTGGARRGGGRLRCNIGGDVR